MSRIYKKKVAEANVWEAALDRIRTVWDMADDVIVSFSGGKDSTVLLNAALAIHKERGETKPLKVLFWDEEAIPMPTIDYVYREAVKENIELHWFCMPVEHRCACSKEHDYWYPWQPEVEDLWTRPLPDSKTYPKAHIWTVDNTENFRRIGVPGQNDWATKQMGCEGTVAMLVGLRAAESLRRYRIVAMKGADALNYVSMDSQCKRIYLVKPIYDFSTEDVWTAHAVFKWDHNTSYDHQQLAGISRHDQRVCPPYGEEPLRGLYMYQICYPELAEKMLYRVPGAATAVRYSRTAVYAFGDYGFDVEKDPEEQIEQALMRWRDDLRVKVKKRIDQEIANHKRKAPGVPIPLKKPGKTGITWDFLYMLAVRGDFKGRKTPTYDRSAS
jgi:predicted phosphoadenosine phosphosulfate sulfurtransferase